MIYSSSDEEEAVVECTPDLHALPPAPKAVSSISRLSIDSAAGININGQQQDHPEGISHSVSVPSPKGSKPVPGKHSHSFDLSRDDSLDISGYSSGASTPRPGSPSNSVKAVDPASLKKALLQQSRLSVTEDDRKSLSGDEESLGPSVKSIDVENKILYLMVVRCIAYPFNAKHQLETSPPPKKLNELRYQQICSVLKSLVDGKHDWYQETMLTPVEQRFSRDDQFLECVEWYIENVLKRRDIIQKCRTGGFSVKELEYIFKVCATKKLTYSSDQQLDTTQLQIWNNTFRKLVEQSYRVGVGTPTTPQSASFSAAVSRPVPNTDKLYKLFQKVLGIKSVEHKVLYRACRLGEPEMEEAVVRRELQARKKKLEDLSSKLTVTFGSHRVEEIYREEQLKMVKQLNVNLDHLSLSASGFSPAQPRRRRIANTVTETGNIVVTKQDLHLRLEVKVTIHEVSHLPSTEGKPVFCVFELVGGGDPLKTQPVIPEYGLAQFGEEGSFRTQSPLPQIKLSLYIETKGVFTDNKVLAKKVHTVIPASTEITHILDLVRSEKETTPFATIKISTLLEKPQNMKKCGYLTCSGDFMFKHLKRRFFALMQLSQYKFLLCTYEPGGMQPKTTLLLEGFTVEYPSIEDKELGGPDPQNKYMFVLVAETAEMGRLRFGCRDDSERQKWLQWMVRATGQNFQPQPDMQDEIDSRYEGFTGSDLDRYGLTDIVNMDITKLDQDLLFTRLFRETLKHQLQEDVFSRGLFSPAQMYVIDEFCARYGVRDPIRHLTCLEEWLACEARGVAIWPVMFLSSFRFCQMHVGRMNPPEKSVIVTKYEQESLVRIGQEIERMVIRKLENFRTLFPFGCPKDDLKVTIKLFNLVASMNHSSNLKSEESPIKILTLCMERAALTNYKQVFGQLELESVDDPLTLSQAKELAQLCIDFMYELHDFYWEDFTPVSTVFTTHVDAFWSFYLVDLREAMLVDSNVVEQLQLFHSINQYFCSQPTMNLGQFHRSFLEEFAPVVEHYLEGLEGTLQTDLAMSLERETWKPDRECCGAVEGVIEALLSLGRFIDQLNWPDENFSSDINSKVQAICVARFREAADFTNMRLQEVMKSRTISLSYKPPAEVFTMLNTLVTLNTRTMQVCMPKRTPASVESGRDIEEYLSQILQSAVAVVIEKLCSPLSMVLNKLAKYDPSDGFLTSVKSFLSSSAPLSDYNRFVSANLRKISGCLVATIFKNFLVNWYECQMQLINQWLTKRPGSLHTEQSSGINLLKNSIREQFADLDVPAEQLSSESFLAIENRLRMEYSRMDLESVGKN